MSKDKQGLHSFGMYQFKFYSIPEESKSENRFCGSVTSATELSGVYFNDINYCNVHKTQCLTLSMSQCLRKPITTPSSL